MTDDEIRDAFSSHKRLIERTWNDDPKTLGAGTIVRLMMVIRALDYSRGPLVAKIEVERLGLSYELRTDKTIASNRYRALADELDARLPGSLPEAAR